MPNQAEAHLSALIESTEDLIWSVDLEYRLIAFNRALRQNIWLTVGVQLETGMRLHELLPPDRAALWPPFFERALHEGPFRVEYSVVLPQILELAFNPIVVDGAVTGIAVFGKDITERKTAERTLKQAEARYRSIFDEASEGIFQTSLDGTLLAGNPALARIMGYDSVDEGLSAVANVANEVWIDPLERERFVQLVVQHGAVRGFECRLRRKDGAIIWVSLNTRLVLGNDGKPSGLEGFLEDISERKQAEDALRESMESLKEAQTIGGLGSYVTDLLAGVWTSSDVLDGIFGIDEHYVRSVDGWAALIHPDDHAMMNAYLADEVLAQRKAFDKEYRIIRQSDQAERWVHGKGRLEFDEQGKPVKMRGVIKDITEQKLTEMRLRESEEQYRTVFQTVPNAFVISRLDDGIIIDANQAFLDSSGFQLSEVIGRTTPELGIWVNVSDRQTLIETVRQKSECRELDIQSRRKNGEIFWMQLSASLIEIGGSQCMLTFAKDITDAKVAEQRLAQTAEALRISEAHYRTVFQTSVDGVAISQVGDGRYIDVNKAFLDLMGYEREEIIGHTSLELDFWVHPDDRERMIAAIRENLSFRNVQSQFLRKNGEIVWILVSGTAIEIDGVPCILSVIRDISDAKAAEQRLAAATEALRLSEQRYRATFQLSIDAISINRLSDGVFVDVNEAFLKFVGYRRDEVIGRNSQDLNFWVDPEDRKRMIETLRENASCGDLEARLRRKNGEIVWGEMSDSIIEVDGVPCILSITRDITGAKAAEKRLAEAREALRLSEERYRIAFQASQDSVNINRLDNGAYVEVNQAFLKIMGYQRHEVIGRTSLELDIWVDPSDRLRLVQGLQLNSTCRDFEARFKRKNGEIFLGMMSASLMELEGVPCILSVTRDISAAKAAEEQIRDLAFYDPLTRLPNRRLLLDRLRQALAGSARTGRKRALLFVDLDNFKTLNDSLGHQTGDLLLQEVAARLVACIRESDTVARLGGDEFVVMLEELSDVPEDAAAQAEVVGEKILAAIDKPFWLGGHECISTSSIGITVFGDKRESTNEVLQQADIAMYQAKAAGRNTLRFFAPALQAAVNARAALEEDIRQAIRNSEFVLYYQPQLDGVGLIGAEALIRWMHPKRGLLAPHNFISLSEETGLILPLGDWALETACAQIAAWANRAEAAHISIAVNISARQFRQPGFVDKVLAALDRTGANPKNLKLELTESMLVENIDDIIAKMTELRSHGLGFSLDDFGTGYSSLAYLKRLPLDQLKIDSSFVRDILLDVGSRAIAQSVISLGRALGLSVIAECVETDEQRVYLSQLGCHAFQGYLFSRPLPLDEFERLWLPTASSKVPVAG